MNTSEQNYKAIRKTAMELFRNRGFDNVTVKEICEASGVPRRSFYALFENKDQLILSYFDLNQELFLDVDSFTELMLLNDSYSKLLGIVSNYLDLLEKNGRNFLSQIFRIGTQDDQNILSVLASGMKDLSSQFIKECQEDGSVLNQTDPDLLWESLTTFLIGICYLWCCGEPFPLKETALSRFEDIIGTRPELRKHHNDTLFLYHEKN
ncbi:MAG: TetR/AcrR family transcriptional regulator [Clostridia bacterium]|nr:TetR/AcrR family transcriptional regulator [Clostridia bacterium]